MKRDIQWRLIHALHNGLIHPLLIFADLCDGTKFDRVADIIYAWHDDSSPQKDEFNVKKFFSK